MVSLDPPIFAVLETHGSPDFVLDPPWILGGSLPGSSELGCHPGHPDETEAYTRRGEEGVGGWGRQGRGVEV